MRTTLEDRALRIASGAVLIDYLPDNYSDLSPKAQDTFLTDNAWEPFEDQPAWFLWEQIETTTAILMQFAKDEIKRSKHG